MCHDEHNLVTLFMPSSTKHDLKQYLHNSSYAVPRPLALIPYRYTRIITAALIDRAQRDGDEHQLRFWQSYNFHT
jgi:hypothetical protein